jgi:adenylate kinase family enzyme
MVVGDPSSGRRFGYRRAVARRIAVMGSSCAGKTTLAAALSERLGVPHVELDALHHGPDWTEATPEELRAKVEAALHGHEGWVADGNYMGKLGTWLIDQADTIVWLDLPLSTSLRRLWTRHRTRIRDGVELWNGNRETWRNAFVGWNALFPYTVHAHIGRKWRWPPRFAGRNVVRLRSPAEVDAWLAAQAPEG